MSSLDTVYNSGLDALANLYEVSLNLETTLQTSLFGSNITSDQLTFRIQDFTLPPAETSTYVIEWGPWTFDRPNGKVNPTRTTNMTIRLDKSYDILQGFYDWKNSIQNENTGVISSLDGKTTDITVFPLNSDGTSSVNGEGTKFINAWPSSIGDVSYSQGSGEPLALTVTWTYLKIDRNFVDST